MSDRLAVVKHVENGIVYHWNVVTLWHLAESTQVEDIPLSVFLPELELDLWFQNYEKPTVINVLKHFARILNVDMDFPVILSPGGFILDGTHRFIKAFIYGHETIKAIRLPYLPQSDYEDDSIFFS